MTVPYAGADPTEPAIDKLRRPYTLPERAFKLFRFGADTVQIAAKLNMNEARALKLLNEERSRALGLPSPYTHTEKPARRIMVVQGKPGPRK